MAKIKKSRKQKGPETQKGAGASGIRKSSSSPRHLPTDDAGMGGFSNANYNRKENRRNDFPEDDRE